MRLIHIIFSPSSCDTEFLLLFLGFLLIFFYFLFFILTVLIIIILTPLLYLSTWTFTNFLILLFHRRVTTTISTRPVPNAPSAGICLATGKRCTSRGAPFGIPSAARGPRESIWRMETRVVTSMECWAMMVDESLIDWARRLLVNCRWVFFFLYFFLLWITFFLAFFFNFFDIS